MSVDQLTAYYLQQGKGGTADPVYRASYIGQRGHGILDTLWRVARPFLTSGAKALGNQALTTGEQILTDIVHNPGDIPAKDIAKTRLKEAGRTVLRKAGVALQDMAGGAKRGRRASPKKKRTTKKKQLGGGKRKTSSCKQSGKGIKRKRTSRTKQSRGGSVRSCSDIFG